FVLHNALIATELSRHSLHDALPIFAFYLLAMVLVGVWFSRKNKNAEQFTKAAGLIPGWAIGLSIYATFLSSNTFLGVPGKAFGRSEEHTSELQSRENLVCRLLLE